MILGKKFLILFCFLSFFNSYAQKELLKDRYQYINKRLYFEDEESFIMSTAYDGRILGKWKFENNKLQLFDLIYKSSIPIEISKKGKSDSLLYIKIKVNGQYLSEYNETIDYYIEFLNGDKIYLGNNKSQEMTFEIDKNKYKSFKYFKIIGLYDKNLKRKDALILDTKYDTIYSQEVLLSLGNLYTLNIELQYFDLMDDNLIETFCLNYKVKRNKLLGLCSNSKKHKWKLEN